MEAREHAMLFVERVVDSREMHIVIFQSFRGGEVVVSTIGCPPGIGQWIKIDQLLRNRIDTFKYVAGDRIAHESPIWERPGGFRIIYLVLRIEVEQFREVSFPFLERRHS